MNKRFHNRINSDNGFMGTTHALSVLALMLALLAFGKPVATFLFGDLIPIKMAIIIVVAIGAGLLPDFDNVKSTAISTMGIFGHLISTFMRALSSMIYAVSHNGKDKPDRDPHRGFWHTITAGLAVGLVSTLLISNLGRISLTIMNKEITWGYLVAGLIIFLGTELMITVFFKKMLAKFTGQALLSISLHVISLATTVLLLYFVPADTSLSFIGAAVSIGWIGHILGDSITTAGVPLTWPISHKGYMWWNWRFPPYIHANGPEEHKIFVPLFTVIAIVSTAMLLFH